MDWIALSLAPGLGPVYFWKLLELFDSPSSVLESRGGELRKLPGLGEGRLKGLSDPDKLRNRAEAELLRLEQMGAEAISYGETDYPALLAQTVNPPPVLYILGKKALLNSPSVAVVGSRAATVYGRRVAFSLSKELAQRAVTVVSGLATGIDAEAHSGCLAAEGRTIGILGCGLDVVYPRSNRTLYSEISRKGLLVSEYTLGTRPEGFRFPARNRIIAGLSCGVVVVEAAKRSGSLITVQCALEEGREIFAVPGQIDSAKSGVWFYSARGSRCCRTWVFCRSPGIPETCLKEP
jgi:DNA processing protein